MRLFEILGSGTTQTPYYHGTTAEFEGVPRPSVSGIYGPGIYVSKRRETATAYAQRQGVRDVIVKTYRVHGPLATDRMLTTALNQARDEGLRGNAKATRANEILSQQGYAGIEDGPVTVIFSAENVAPV